MAKDIIHDAVKNALIKDGWTVTHDPLTLVYEDVQVFVDLGAERVIAAERNDEKIAVEIKSFVGRSATHDMEVALGQYTLYRTFLNRLKSNRTLYLAISHIVHADVFRSKAFQALIEDNNVPLIIVNVVLEEVTQWIPK